MGGQGAKRGMQAEAVKPRWDSMWVNGTWDGARKNQRLKKHEEIQRHCDSNLDMEIGSFGETSI